MGMGAEMFDREQMMGMGRGGDGGAGGAPTGDEDDENEKAYVAEEAAKRDAARNEAAGAGSKARSTLDIWYEKYWRPLEPYWGPAYKSVSRWWSGLWKSGAQQQQQKKADL
jgi:hypothetical protein